MTRFLLPLLLLASLSACDYKPESFPNHISADYEIAFPIADTIFAIDNFFQFSSLPPVEIGLPKGTVVNIVLDYPFYLADLSENSYEIFWIGPKAFIDNQFPQLVDIRLSCYIIFLNMQQYVLADDKQLPLGESVLFTDKHINNSEYPLAQANKLYIILELETKGNTSVQQLMESELNVSFGLKVGLRIHHSL